MVRRVRPNMFIGMYGGRENLEGQAFAASNLLYFWCLRPRLGSRTTGATYNSRVACHHLARTCEEHCCRREDPRLILYY